jgi:two-component system NtrC family sensor kinase
MTNLLTIISRSLAAKLILALALLIVIGGGISSYALIHAGRRNLVNEAVKDAAATTDLVKKSVRYSMLTRNREAIQRTIDDLKSAKDIKKIELFDSMGTIFYSSDHAEIGHQASKADRACQGCHGDRETSADTLGEAGQWQTYRGEEGFNMLTFIKPIYNEPSCYTSACHVHGRQKHVLGILAADFSLAAVDKNIKKETITTTLYVLALMGMISVVLYLILRKFVLKPVTSLSNAMATVAEGNLAPRVTPVSRDEIGLLVRTFNGMLEELRQAREKLVDWTASLEREVAAKSSELKRSRDKLIEAEKLAALGRMTADVAHEIRNPLTAIGGFARRLHKSATGEKEKERAEVIVSEVNRLEKILRDVLTFSRDVQSRLEMHPVEEIVHEVVTVHKRVFSEQSITIEAAIEEGIPPILIDKDQVKQALTNLIMNAYDAMPLGGTLKISAGLETFNEVRYVVLQVSDTGHGIDEANYSLIFEPFFTTKEAGRGTGLGLSITRKIMEEHGGFVKATTVAGKGALFSLYFPQQSKEESHMIKCWEYKKCGREKDATTKCPAYSNFGRICWSVAGTFCEGKVQGTFAQKYEDCRKCDYYQMLKREREHGT